MTDRTVFAGVFLAVVAAAGLTKGVDAAWICSAGAAAAATIGEELRGLGVSRMAWKVVEPGNRLLVDTDASERFKLAGDIFAAVSWLVAAAGGVSLLIG